jgi:hypothetical protein
MKPNCEECDYKRDLLYLLSVIHKDDGNFTERKGLNKSMYDAIQTISRYRMMIYGL